MLPITHGVPQGSVLDPVLFIIFSNDMPKHLQDICQAIMYSDDTTLLVSDKTPNNLAVSTYLSLNTAYQYCHNYDLVRQPH